MKGILFTPDSRKAIRDRRKTVTRRVINPQPWRGAWNASEFHPSYGWFWKNLYQTWKGEAEFFDRLAEHSRYQVGEIVYIKEAWATHNRYNHLKPSELPQDAWLFYFTPEYDYDPFIIGKKRSPLFMPAWAARDFIKILDRRAERLQEITEIEAELEGSPVKGLNGGLLWFRDTWNSINPKYPWQSNPWVWRYEFEVVEK